MGFRKSFLIRALTSCFVGGLLLTSAAAAFAQNRVFAIGDVHGAYAEFVAILKKTGLTDANQKWIGGSAILIQTGDMLDRGTQSRDCLDLLMDLERQAGKKGGKVFPLLGNHEVINILGDVRYVTPDIYRTFATKSSDKAREKAFREYTKFLSSHRDHAHAAASSDEEAARRKWAEEHPPGYFEYRDAFGPRGKYGAWLRTHQAIAKLEGGLFLHGGLNPALEIQDISELNDRIRLELNAFDSIWQSLVKNKVIWRYMTLDEALRQVNEELQWIQTQGDSGNPELVQQMQLLLSLNNWMIVSQQGPFWYRGLAQGSEEELAGPLKAMLARLKAQYIVAGHTVASTSMITTRFENHVFLIDTGMLKEAYGGRASALEIKGGQFTAHYADGEAEILSAPGLKIAAFFVIPGFMNKPW